MTSTAALDSPNAARASVRARAGATAGAASAPPPWDESWPADEGLLPLQVPTSGLSAQADPPARPARKPKATEADPRPARATGEPARTAAPGDTRAPRPARPPPRDAAPAPPAAPPAGAAGPALQRPRDEPAASTAAQAFDLRLMRLASRVLLLLAVVALIAWGLVWLARGPWFAFRQLTVQGELTHNSVASLRSQVLGQLQGGYFTLDLQSARAAFETAPWVRHAQLRRVWPDRLVVRLEEHQPRAVWAHEDEEDQLVNTHGEVFDGNAADLDDSLANSLPVLRGPAGSAPQMVAMHARLAPLFAPVGAELKHLELSERGSWRARLASGSVLELGRGEPAEVEQRTRRFVASVGEVSNKLGRRAVESADLRHSEGYALKLVGMGTREATRRGVPARTP
ncbi:MAG: hypothetical protein RL375_2988 [Pseudomonadota bacterium]